MAGGFLGLARGRTQGTTLFVQRHGTRLFFRGRLARTVLVQRFAFSGQLLGGMRFVVAALAVSRTSANLRGGRRRAEQDQGFAQMMDGRARQRFADGPEHGFTGIAIFAAGPDLDKLMGVEGAVDFFQDGIGQPGVADQHDGAQGVGGGTKIAARARGEF